MTCCDCPGAGDAGDGWMRLTAPAKVNLFLKIQGKRPDGYHDISSFMQKLSLGDELFLRLEAGTGIDIHVAGRDIPPGENIAVSAARAFFEKSGICRHLSIRLNKRIPVAAGLGGGSSDAAAVLLGLNRLFDFIFSPEELRRLGLALGADVPFFLTESDACWAKGVGELLQPVSSLFDCHVLLVNPGFPVSTRWVYENFRLTPTAEAGKEVIFNTVDNGVRLFNDLEVVTIAAYPEIKDIKDEVLAEGGFAAIMSGSGPTVAGFFYLPDEICADRCRRIFATRYGDENVFLCRPHFAAGCGNGCG